MIDPFEANDASAFRFGSWYVEPGLNRLSRKGEERQLEAKAMDVLVFLIDHADRVVPTAELLDAVWSGRVVEQSAVHRRISELRRALGDDSRHPTYIRTIVKRGYQAVAPVERARGERAKDEMPPAEDPLGRSLSGVGVLPFDDLSPSGAEGWLADGITEELIEALGRIESLHVPARRSTALLKEQHADLESIGRQLDVGTVVTGTVRLTQSIVTITVQWQRVNDGARLWSARYERPLDDLLAIQKQTAVGIAEAIRTELGIMDPSGWEVLQARRYQTSDVRAWTEFRKGFALALTFTLENLAPARELFEAALEYDPDYLAARAMLAWSHLEDQDVRAAGAREVLAVDPGNTTANMILIEGAITTWDSASAERLLEQALAASPRVHNLAAPGHHLYTGMGRLDEALAIARRGVRADPLWWSQTMFLGRSLLNLGRAAEAIEPLERSLALRRSGYMAILPLALAYWREGRQDEALATMLAGFPEHEALIQGSWASGEWTGMNLALANNLDRPMAAIGGTYLDDQLKCRLYAVAGAEAEVYRWLEQLLEDTRVVATRDREAFRKVSFLSEAVKSDAAYDHYRHQRRFREISAEIDGRMAAAAGTYELARA